MKIVVIGGSTQDIFLNIDGAHRLKATQELGVKNSFFFEEGTKVEVKNLSYHSGGGGTNSAVAFKRLGFQVACFSLVGDDAAGEYAVCDLHKEGVDTSSIVITTEHPTSISVILNASPLEETVFVHRGANNFISRDNIPYQKIQESDYVYITSLSGQSSLILPDIVSYASNFKVEVALNPGTSQLSSRIDLLQSVLASVRIFILNAFEAKMFMKALIMSDEKYVATLVSRNHEMVCPVDVVSTSPYLLTYLISSDHFLLSLKAFFQEVVAMGPSIVVVTNGNNGVYVATHEALFFHPSVAVELMSTVGAGDAFGSCFVAHVARGESIENALRKGIINSSSVLSKTGAKTGLLSVDDLSERMSSLDLSLLQKFSW